MIDLSEQQESIRTICIDLGVRTLELVGSATRSDFDPTRSDVDLLVLFDGTSKLFDRYFELKTRLELSIGREVDLIQPAAIKNPIVKQNLEKNRVLLYGA